MLKVLSVSLGSSKRDHMYVGTFLGRKIGVVRVGTDGNFQVALGLMREFAQDSQVQCIGLGGIDRYLSTPTKDYEVKQAKLLIEAAGETPVVDGSAIKHNVEKRLIYDLSFQELINKTDVALVPSAFDRIGMALALYDVCTPISGDIMFALGLNVPMRHPHVLEKVGRALLPIATQLPIATLYPTGKKQHDHEPKFHWAFEQARIYAGDFHYINRHAPKDLTGKMIITNTTTQENKEELQARGLKTLITTTRPLDEESYRTFGTNVIQAIIVAATGKRPEEISGLEYRHYVAEMNLGPLIQELN